MAQNTQRKPLGQLYKNPYETKGSPSGANHEKLPNTTEGPREHKQESYATGNFNREFTIFKNSDHYEAKVVPQQLSELMNQLKVEIAEIKKRNQEMIAEVAQIEKETLKSLPTKAGIYHVRFAEILLEMLRGLRAKMGEANNWMMAMMSKKKKRGSAFAVQSKKKGTQYSMSQELSNARSVM